MKLVEWCTRLVAETVQQCVAAVTTTNAVKFVSSPLSLSGDVVRHWTPLCRQLDTLVSLPNIVLSVRQLHWIVSLMVSDSPVIIPYSVSSLCGDGTLAVVWTRWCMCSTDKYSSLSHKWILRVSATDVFAHQPTLWTLWQKWLSSHVSDPLYASLLVWANAYRPIMTDDEKHMELVARPSSTMNSFPPVHWHDIRALLSVPVSTAASTAASTASWTSVVRTPPTVVGSIDMIHPASTSQRMPSCFDMPRPLAEPEQLITQSTTDSVGRLLHSVVLPDVKTDLCGVEWCLTVAMHYSWPALDDVDAVKTMPPVPLIRYAPFRYRFVHWISTIVHETTQPIGTDLVLYILRVLAHTVVQETVTDIDVRLYETCTTLVTQFVEDLPTRARLAKPLTHGQYTLLWVHWLLYIQAFPESLHLPVRVCTTREWTVHGFWTWMSKQMWCLMLLPTCDTAAPSSSSLFDSIASLLKSSHPSKKSQKRILIHTLQQCLYHETVRPIWLNLTVLMRMHAIPDTDEWTWWSQCHATVSKIPRVLTQYVCMGFVMPYGLEHVSKNDKKWHQVDQPTSKPRYETPTNIADVERQYTETLRFHTLLQKSMTVLTDPFISGDLVQQQQTMTRQLHVCTSKLRDANSDNIGLRMKLHGTKRKSID